MLCSKCTWEIPDDSTSCPYCGAVISASAGSPFQKAGDLGAAGGSVPDAVRPPMPSTPTTAAGSYCHHCGAPLESKAKFCTACGTNVDSDPTRPAHVPASRPKPGVDRTCPPAPPTGGIRTTHSTRRAICDLCISPLSLVAIVAYSLTILFNLIGALNGSTGIFGKILDSGSMWDLKYMLGDAYDVIKGVSTFTAIIGVLPTILIAVGLWMIYASAKQNSIKTTGFIIIKVIIIIQFVFFCIGLVVVEIAALVMAISLSDYEYMMGILIAVIFGLAIVGALLVVYYLKAIQTVDTIKTSFVTGNPSDKVSVYVAVWSFISAGASLISVFMGGGALTVLTALCSAVASAAFGALIFSYREKMRR